MVVLPLLFRSGFDSSGQLVFINMLPTGMSRSLSWSNQEQRSSEKEVAQLNIWTIPDFAGSVVAVLALDTFQLDNPLPVKFEAYQNMYEKSSTLDTSHCSMPVPSILVL